MGPEIVVPVAGIVMIITLAIGVPLVRAYARSLEAASKSPQIPHEVAARLERMEQSLEAVAIEIERISEGQRFTTKLLSEGNRSGRQIGAGNAPADNAP